MQSMNKGMKSKGYSALTIKAYRRGAGLQAYSLHLLEHKFTHSYVNQAISAIQFYRRYVVGLKDDAAAGSRSKNHSYSIR
ncbi:hypothetical protein D3C78_1298300 [compost metagenome]